MTVLQSHFSLTIDGLFNVLIGSYDNGVPELTLQYTTNNTYDISLMCGVDSGIIKVDVCKRGREINGP